jgi:peptide/nickel transport system permease protein
MRHKLAAVALVLLIVVGFFVLFAPVVAPYDPDQINLRDRLQGPGRSHWLGTDESGRDNFTRLLYGGRISLTVGIVAMLISIGLGTVTGTVAGYCGGWIDAVIMRITDGMLAIPTFFLVLIVISVYGATLGVVTLVIGLTSWMGCTRIVRGDILRSAHLEYATASKASGASPVRILYRHLLPQAIPSIIVTSTLGVAQAVLLESTLSYLGLGIQPPVASWGNMLSNAQDLIFSSPFQAVYPGFAILFTVLAFNALGEGIREMNDPSATR